MEAGSTHSVVVIGSTNTDLIMQVAELPAPGETVGDATFSQALGGKGANQALAAARSGADVTFVSVVGDDDYGRHAREAFSSEGIDVTLMATDSEPPLGIPSFLWGCILGVIGILLVYILTDGDKLETKKALWGMLVWVGVWVILYVGVLSSSALWY